MGTLYYRDLIAGKDSLKRERKCEDAELLSQIGHGKQLEFLVRSRTGNQIGNIIAKIALDEEGNKRAFIVITDLTGTVIEKHGIIYKTITINRNDEALWELAAQFLLNVYDSSWKDLANEVVPDDLTENEFLQHIGYRFSEKASVHAW